MKFYGVSTVINFYFWDAKWTLNEHSSGPEQYFVACYVGNIICLICVSFYAKIIIDSPLKYQPTRPMRCKHFVVEVKTCLWSFTKAFRHEPHPIPMQRTKAIDKVAINFV